MYKVKSIEKKWYICRIKRGSRIKRSKNDFNVTDVLIKNPIYCTVRADKHFLKAFTKIENIKNFLEK